MLLQLSFSLDASSAKLKIVKGELEWEPGGNLLTQSWETEEKNPRTIMNILAS